MAESMIYDYYYGDESSQFSFYRIPRQLVTGQQFKKISTDAKLLYGLLLDRMGLSARNGWYDDAGRVYIFYTLDEVQEDLNCGHEKAVKLLSELDTDKGCGLIERVKQGQGRPTKIYVKRFTTRRVPTETPAPQEIPRLPKIGSQEVGKSEVKSSDNPKSRLPFFRSADFGKSDGNYIESNQTDFSYKNQSIHPSPSAEQPGWMDRSEYLREIKENIEYPFLCQQFKFETHFYIISIWRNHYETHSIVVHHRVALLPVDLPSLSSGYAAPDSDALSHRGQRVRQRRGNAVGAHLLPVSHR